jgi:hypothetical protein
VNLKIVPDITFERTYNLYDDKRQLAVILEDLDGTRELAFTVKRLKISELQEVYEFVWGYNKWLTGQEWLM